MKVKTKPIVKEAMQFCGTKESATEVLTWAGPKCGMEMRYTSHQKHPCILVIQTLEGEMRAFDGDWIIRGVNGELYPCKPDIFEKTYESAD